MKRHKYVTTYKGEWQLFDELREKDMVVEEYDYCTRRVHAGDVFTVSDSVTKRKYMAISTQNGRVYTRWNGCRRSRTYYKTMLLLNEEGTRYIKQLIMEERV